MTREITHMKAFAAALESLGKPAFSIVQIAPTPKLVNQYFNDSTDEGEHGEIDARGPWNDGADWEFVEAPAFQIAGDLVPNGEVHIDSSGAPDERMKELLIDCMKDLLHAEKQLIKALPRWQGGPVCAAPGAVRYAPCRNARAGRTPQRLFWNTRRSGARKAVQGNAGDR